MRWRDKIKLGYEAARFLIVARFMVSCWKFKEIAVWLKKSTHTTDGLELQEARRLGRSIDRVSRYLPFRCTCLVKSIAVTGMLRKRGARSTLYLGLKKSEKKKLEAHAWTKYNGVYITGGQGASEFTVVGDFSSEII